MAARSKLQDAAFHLMAAVRRGVVSAMARPVKQEEVCAWARAAAQCLRELRLRDASTAVLSKLRLAA
ncbi:hypothetical protein HaLaN_05062 [Haematococcus lacustris]|uniref:Uncharacterized protein n=1 Tax=Haematococcus lacustris TaxID=44745 RepID=A0A699YID5_HAELA|nr:hypothetical protein HaLaN_05062 [Haematococcus lacustris]